MKIASFIGLGFILILNIGCKPDKRGNKGFDSGDEHNALVSKLDSLTDVDKDGLDYMPLNTGNYKEIPKELTDLLNKDFKEWTLPNFSDKLLKKLPPSPQGPLFLKEDFNADGNIDYAVQILNNDSLKVVAYIYSKNNLNYKKYIIESHQLILNGVDKPNSLYLLLRKPVAKLPGKYITSPKPNPVLVTDGKAIRAYIFENDQVYLENLVVE